MVSNFDRIHAEIKKEAAAVSPGCGLDSDSLSTLVMTIVDIVDRNQKKARPRINKDVARMIHDATVSRAATGGA